MILDLVRSGHDCRLCEQFLKEGDGEIGYADCFDFSAGEELFEGFVGVDVGYAGIEIAGAVGEFWEEGVVSWGLN